MKYIMIALLALPLVACNEQRQEQGKPESARNKTRPAIPGRDRHGLPLEAKDWQQPERESSTAIDIKSYEEKGPKGPQAQEEAKDKEFNSESSKEEMERKQQGD